MNKIRRDVLKRMAERGELILAGSYHFDDMSGGEHRKNLAVPVEIMPDKREHCTEGICYLYQSDFTSGSGYASLSDDGLTAHLGVHSNCNYDLKRADGQPFTSKAAKLPKAQRPENKRMQEFLAANGIEAVPKYFSEGSMRGTWRLYNPAIKWSMELAEKLNALGFRRWDSEPLGRWDGNGGDFCAFVRGHNEFLQGEAPAIPAPVIVPIMPVKPVQSWPKICIDITCRQAVN